MKKIFFCFALLISAAATAQIDTTIWLDGSASLYADTYKWRQIEGPTVTLSAPDSAKCQAMKLRLGRYRFELTCTNNFGTDRDTLTVTVVSAVLGIDVDQFPQRPRQPGAPSKLQIIAYLHGNHIMVQIKSPQRQKMACVIYDVLGREIGRTEVTLSTGNNNIRLDKPRISGIYYLRFFTYFQAQTRSIVI